MDIPFNWIGVSPRRRAGQVMQCCCATKISDRQFFCVDIGTRVRCRMGSDSRFQRPFNRAGLRSAVRQHMKVWPPLAEAPSQDLGCEVSNRTRQYRASDQDFRTTISLTRLTRGFRIAADCTLVAGWAGEKIAEMGRKRRATSGRFSVRQAVAPGALGHLDYLRAPARSRFRGRELCASSFCSYSQESSLCPLGQPIQGPRSSRAEFRSFLMCVPQHPSPAVPERRPRLFLHGGGAGFWNDGDAPNPLPRPEHSNQLIAYQPGSVRLRNRKEKSLGLGRKYIDALVAPRSRHTFA